MGFSLQCGAISVTRASLLRGCPHANSGRGCHFATGPNPRRRGCLHPPTCPQPSRPLAAEMSPRPQPRSARPEAEGSEDLQQERRHPPPTGGWSRGSGVQVYFLQTFHIFLTEIFLGIFEKIVYLQYYNSYARNSSRFWIASKVFDDSSKRK